MNEDTIENFNSEILIQTSKLRKFFLGYLKVSEILQKTLISLKKLRKKIKKNVLKI
jgi:hypothetical protein